MNKLINSLKKAGINISSHLESIFSKCVEDYMDNPENFEQKEALSQQEEIIAEIKGKNGIYTGTKQKSCIVGMDIDLPLKTAVRRKYYGL